MTTTEKTFSTAFLRESADEFRVLETYQINEWISSNSLEQLVNMLLKGRVDFIQGVPLSIYHEVKALNISNNSIVQTREPTYSGLAGFIIDKNKFTTNQISKLVISRNKLLTSTKMIPVYEKFNFKQADLTNEI